MASNRKAGGDNLDLSLTGSQVLSARSSKSNNKRPSSSGGRIKANNSNTATVCSSLSISDVQLQWDNYHKIVKFLWDCILIKCSGNDIFLPAKTYSWT